jgi:ATP-dependent protease Clp ATPase subunit
MEEDRNSSNIFSNQDINIQYSLIKNTLNCAKSNICLYGPPGSGKSVVAKKLGELLNMPVYDVDDDHLESDWKMSVAEKLELVGDELFLKAEERNYKVLYNICFRHI